MVKKFTAISIFLILVVACSPDDVRQEDDFNKLAAQLLALQQEAAQTPCIDANDWSFVPIGSKACGGPHDFIAYPLNGSATLFLDRVQAYTNLEDRLNKKWGVVSDCAIVNAPQAVNCINGIATLIYE